jgi:ferredoxin
MSERSECYREGSLEAPTRHPIRWQEPGFYDEAAPNAELARVFDVCHGCRRCVSLCNTFPTLFDLVDNSPTLEVDGIDKAHYPKVVEQCYLYDLCYMTKCPYVPPSCPRAMGPSRPGSSTPLRIPGAAPQGRAPQDRLQARARHDRLSRPLSPAGAEHGPQDRRGLGPGTGHEHRAYRALLGARRYMRTSGAIPRTRPPPFTSCVSSSSRRCGSP